MKEARTLDRREASSFARMLVLQHGVEGAPRKLATIRRETARETAVVHVLCDCNGNGVDCDQLTAADFDRIAEYVDRHSLRLSEFFGASELVAQP